jgi:hypothetical protein
MGRRSSFWVGGLIGSALIAVAAWTQGRFLLWSAPSDGFSIATALRQIGIALVCVSLAYGGILVGVHADQACRTGFMRGSMPALRRDPRWGAALGVTLIALLVLAFYGPIMNKRLTAKWPLTGLAWGVVPLVAHWCALVLWWRIWLQKRGGSSQQSTSLIGAPRVALNMAGAALAIVGTMAWRFVPLAGGSTTFAAMMAWFLLASGFLSTRSAVRA